MPDDVFKVKMPTVETWHFRDHAASAVRKEQRKVQNRVTLMDDWVSRKSEHSLWHLAAEWREFNSDKAISYYEEFLRSDSKIGDARYQARLILAKEHALAGIRARDAGDMDEFTRRLAEARAVLIPATADNWWRTEHWIALGDIAAEQELWDEALQWFKYSAAQIGNPPFVLWWIDDCAYSYLPAQRLATTYATLGMYAEALTWAREAEKQLPDDTPAELRSEANENIKALEEALENGV
jgi:tetratricopeptide (TPR) repeat protein